MIQPAPNAFPSDLQSLDQWVCWRYEDREGRKTKIPYTPSSGRMASSTNPRTWTTYAIAVAAAEEYDGVGFVFARGGGIVGADIDECIVDGVISGDARRVIDAFDTYAEVSPSGEGIHLFIRGKLPEGKRRRGLYEIYEEGRYFTVTGNQIAGTPVSVEERQEQIEQFHAWLATPLEDGPAPKPLTLPVVSFTAKIDDSDLIERARRAKNGVLFDSLWRGDTAKYGGDQSAADLALCNVLGFWTGGDPVRIDRLVRQSGLYRPKWDERRGDRTYGDKTIDVAITSLRDVYEPRIELGRVVFRSRDGRQAYVDVETGEIADTAEPEPRFTLHWASEALEPQPPLTWFVENIAAAGTVNLWVGAGGTYKTYCLLDMLVHVAMGIDWIGHKVARGPVLIIDEESGPRRLKRRLAEVMRAHGAPANLNLAFVSLQALNLRNEADHLALESLFQQVRPSIVLVDALADIMPGADENAVSDTQPVFQVLRRLAEMYDTSIQTIHHANKIGGYRGSTAIQAAVDLMVMVEREKTGEAFTLATVKTRDVEPFKLTVTPHFESDGAESTFDLERIENADGEAKPKRVPSSSRVIRSHLEKFRTGTIAQIAESSEANFRTLQTAMARLVTEGEVRRAGTEGQSDVWELARAAGPTETAPWAR